MMSIFTIPVPVTGISQIQSPMYDGPPVFDVKDDVESDDDSDYRYQHTM